MLNPVNEPNIKIVCQECEKVFKSFLEKDGEAISDAISQLRAHVKHRHKDSFVSYENHLAEMITATASLSAFLFFANFVNDEHDLTSSKVKELGENLNELVFPLTELFGDEEEEDIEEDDLIKGINEGISENYAKTEVPEKG